MGTDEVKLIMHKNFNNRNLIFEFYQIKKVAIIVIK